MGLVDGPYQDREPVTGWQDNTSCAVEQELAWAHQFGIDFFVFDWYYKPDLNYGEPLNAAFDLTRALPDRHGMQYAILYIDGQPFDVGPADWAAQIDQWSGYFIDPDYLRINGMPAFFVIDMAEMRQVFGSSSGAAGALNQLRAAAQAHGLPGVYIVGGFGVPDGSLNQDGLFPDVSIAQGDGYDAITTYNYPYAPAPFDGMLPYSTLSDTGKWIWTQAVLKSPVPFISIAMGGWDPRPWNEREPLTNDLMWYSRSPQQVATFVNDSVTFAESNPQLRPEPSPAPPLVLIEAWNELGEGSFIIPTVGDGSSYGNALAAMLTVPPTRTRGVLTVDETGPSDPNRNASGSLTDAAGTPIARTSVALTATPVDGTGFFTQYPISGTAPAGAVQAVVGFRVNIEDAGPGASDFSLYQISYIQPDDGIERVANGDFSSRTQSWILEGQAQLVASDHGPGQMVEVQALPSQFALLNSAPFAVTAGDAFQLSFSARVAPLSVGSGYFTLIFLDANGEFLRERIPLAAEKLTVGSTTTDSVGNYQMSLTSLGASHVLLEATYAGDAQHWPAYARVAR